MNFLQAKKQLADNKLNIAWSNIDDNDRFDEKDIAELINQAARKMWDEHDWDFTEGQFEGVISNLETQTGYVQYPERMLPGSMKKWMFINDEPVKKVDYYDFVRAMKSRRSHRAEIYAEYKHNLYFNTDMVKIGDKLEAFGKLAYVNMTDDKELLPFSHSASSQSSGDDAIVQYAYGLALESDKLRETQRGKAEKQEAMQDVNELWESFSDDRSQKDMMRKQFNVPDYFSGNGGVASSTNNPGRFNI